MNPNFKKCWPLLVIIFLFLFQLIEIKAQKLSQNAFNKRYRENFDFNWQFHKGDIAIKKAVKVGNQGGLTDINIKIITNHNGSNNISVLKIIQFRTTWDCFDIWCYPIRYPCETLNVFNVFHINCIFLQAGHFFIILFYLPDSPNYQLKNRP